MAKRKKKVAKAKFVIPKKGTKARKALMTKKPPKKKTAKKIDPDETLRKELAKHRKDELIECLIELAQEGVRIRRQITERFNIHPSSDDLIDATRSAICDATDFDEREINYNFDYNYAAYREIGRNLKKLIKLGQLPDVMQLSLELMEQGSYQVEMSDEGMMTEDIEECLAVAIKGIEKSDLSPGEIVAWCSSMLKKDCVGCICDTELEILQEKFASKSRR